MDGGGDGGKVGCWMRGEALSAIWSRSSIVLRMLPNPICDLYQSPNVHFQLHCTYHMDVALVSLYAGMYFVRFSSFWTNALVLLLSYLSVFEFRAGTNCRGLQSVA